MKQDGKSNELINYFESLGLDVHTSTKARGHLGFFLNGRIDISKNTPQDRIIPTLIHEFSHYIHSKIEKNIAKNGGTLQKIFNTNKNIEDELFKVTNFVDEHSKCEKLLTHKNIVIKNIKNLDEQIKKEFPNFKRSKPFKEFNKGIKGTNLKYLLKYDKVRIMPWFLFGKEEVLSISTLEKDFPNLKPAFVDYIRLKSYSRKQNRISARISKLQKYYKRPTELFARFTEGLYIDKNKVKELAPFAYKRFFELLDSGYYQELKNIFEILEIYEESKVTIY